MTAKEWLSQMWTLDDRVERKLEEVYRMRSQIERANAVISDMPRGGGRHDWTDTLIKATELERKLLDDIRDMMALKSEIHEAIDLIDDARLRQLLELRYINHRSWRAIAREMHYDESWVYVLHGKALRQITVPAKVSR